NSPPVAGLSFDGTTHTAWTAKSPVTGRRRRGALRLRPRRSRPFAARISSPSPTLYLQSSKGSSQTHGAFWISGGGAQRGAGPRVWAFGFWNWSSDVGNPKSKIENPKCGWVGSRYH